MKTIRLAVAGVGNCASSLLQGIEYYRTHTSAETAGLTHAAIGGYHGYHRNKKSTGWAVAWGVAGTILPIITTGVTLFQGVGKPKRR